MYKYIPFLIFLVVLLSACNLAGDITPPPGLQTAQANRPTIGPTGIPETDVAPVALVPPTTRADLQNGAELYVEKCAPCHGEEGGGDGPQAVNIPEGITVAALNNPEIANFSSPAEWFSIVTNGNFERFMPGFSSMSDAERWDVVAYALSLSSSPEEIAAGEVVYLEHCADCHGEEGGGTENGSALADPSSITHRTIDELKSIVREGTDRQMPGFGSELSEPEIQGVSVYLMNLGITGDGPEAVEEVIVDSLEPDSGAIQGQVISGTNGAEIPVDLEVTLYGFDGQQEIFRESTVVDETGAFEFDERELQPGWVFVAAAEHQGVLYGSEIVEFSGTDEIFLSLTFYETSTDLSSVRVDRLHTIFDMPSAGLLEVTELWIISNFGEYTVATEDGVGILEIPLPEGATNVRFEGGSLGERYHTSPRGFIDTLPLRPGSGIHELIFFFELPYVKRLDFEQPMDYPVDAIVILSPASGPEIEGAGILDLGTREMSGTLLRNFSAEPIPAGDAFEVELRGAGNVQGTGADSLMNNIVVGIGSLLIAAIVVGVWWFRRKDDSGELMDEFELEPSLDISTNADDQHALVRSIANLDDAFEAGEIEDREYQEQRSDLKARLVELMQVEEYD